MVSKFSLRQTVDRRYLQMCNTLYKIWVLKQTSKGIYVRIKIGWRGQKIFCKQLQKEQVHCKFVEAVISSLYKQSLTELPWRDRWFFINMTLLCLFSSQQKHKRRVRTNK